LLHSVFGRRPAIDRTAVRLRELGCQVLAPDLFDGLITSDLNVGVGLRDRWPRGALLEHLRAVVTRHGWSMDLPVVMGYCWGASTAVRLVASGLVTRGLVLFHGAPRSRRDWT
jgi:dienelactone hydrolase